MFFDMNNSRLARQFIVPYRHQKSLSRTIKSFPRAVYNCSKKWLLKTQLDTRSQGTESQERLLPKISSRACRPMCHRRTRDFRPGFQNGRSPHPKSQEQVDDPEVSSYKMCFDPRLPAPGTYPSEPIWLLTDGCETHFFELISPSNSNLLKILNIARKARLRSIHIPPRGILERALERRNLTHISDGPTGGIWVVDANKEGVVACLVEEFKDGWEVLGMGKGICEGQIFLRHLPQQKLINEERRQKRRLIERWLGNIDEEEKEEDKSREDTPEKAISQQGHEVVAPWWITEEDGKKQEKPDQTEQIHEACLPSTPWTAADLCKQNERFRKEHDSHSRLISGTLMAPPRQTPQAQRKRQSQEPHQESRIDWRQAKTTIAKPVQWKPLRPAWLDNPRKVTILPPTTPPPTATATAAAAAAAVVETATATVTQAQQQQHQPPFQGRRRPIPPKGAPGLLNPDHPESNLRKRGLFQSLKEEEEGGNGNGNGSESGGKEASDQQG